MSTSKQQMEIMLSFIEENPEMAQNYNECTAQDRQNINELWDELRTELNSLGYPNKSTSGWRKVWADHKYREKKRLSSNRISIQKSGEEMSEELLLTAAEERIVELENLETTIDGDSIKIFRDDPLLSTSITVQSPITVECLEEDNIPTSTSKEQMDIMLSFIANNPEMARNFNQCTAQERQKINKLWEELRTELNSMGLPNRTTTGWRKVWADRKYKTKKKLNINRRSLQKSGGEPSEEVTLTADEEMIVELANLDSAIDNEPNKNFEDDTLSSRSESPRSPNMTDSSPEDDNQTPTTNKRKRSSQNDNAEKTNSRSDILDLLREHVKGEREYKKKKLRYQEKIVQLMREGNEEERSFHSSMLKLFKEKNGLLRQIPREFESEED
ncbi:uncharacterized protein LOC119636649 [Glossina fuscipes]|uniref:Regulatory protein zeste n=1 Tax=Glossina fuscipes TaxID=7396 RepID=A0A9C5Z229_9MUSC|nr:uncharacterized protein LOC119636649 [Glossina fuscipes]XP_037888071.1 uncharacterized protein LOC119636649 [Glossina fuscipes]XP_037888072.1 uncharacterized protein LOC119636649 [Glossina fuscipes]XP_037888073.1 uncharacterized protein LOC119636649 [Glossina fuscipes]XP_037888074.1 uncharacterized protein LOC119636649 [Glossina fuscipes]